MATSCSKKNSLALLTIGELGALSHLLSPRNFAQSATQPKGPNRPPPVGTTPNRNPSPKSSISNP
ncbi:hypothetical protein RND71_035267 [Anisodus tanguticus]|uniref:Uncharacterized protein n=1 Tax=Anisodus tanguticus TaxID=243964 RepID=A0AAE1R4M0_9SOLA|nr:hypothetical protein RND71_035267 [Anisodus tanguticus]